MILVDGPNANGVPVGLHNTRVINANLPYDSSSFRKFRLVDAAFRFDWLALGVACDQRNAENRNTENTMRYKGKSPESTKGTGRQSEGQMRTAPAALANRLNLTNGHPSHSLVKPG